MATSPTSHEWDDALLEPLRRVGDEPADRAIAALYATRDTPMWREIHRELDAYVNNSASLPPDLPPELTEYLAAMPRLSAAELAPRSRSVAERNAWSFRRKMDQDRRMAERARFELAVEFPLQQFSRLPPSTTRPPLQTFKSSIEPAYLPLLSTSFSLLSSSTSLLLSQ